MATTINNSKSNSFKTFGTTSVNKISLQNSVSIFPSPNNGEFKIQSSKFSVQSLAVFNVYGEKVYSNSVNNTSCIVTLAVPNGIYFLKMIADNGITVKKIIINR